MFTSLIDNYLVVSVEARHPVKDNTNKAFIKDDVLKLINKYFTNIPLNDRLQQILNTQIPVVANQVADAASSISSKNALPFLETNNGDTKQLGYISNIYVNLNYLYEQAISKNHASNDTQNTNIISIRDYIQGIMRDIQNSLGNINSFDIQVDNRNAIGRIIDIAFTGSTKEDLFLLQMHNLNSVVRDYKFSSKIFPEMGSIIAISAQDATGIGKLGYDNATLVAWNKGITDRLIPKKDFNSTIAIADGAEPASFLLPFLTKIYNYFQYINGVPNENSKDNFNYAYGGLDFAYRDFLANLDRFDPQNKFKTIIPTELTITLDGLGGIIIGNIFKINQDIIPKGYKNTSGRDIAYIVTRLGHQISGNDWTTELSAYPVVFENTKGTKVWKQWNKNQYPGSTVINVGGRRLVIPSSQAIQDNYIPARDKALSNRPNGIKLLLTAQAQLEGFKPGNINFDLNNPGNFTGPVGDIPTAGRGEGSRNKFVKYASLEDGIKASAAQIDLIISGKSSVYPKNATLSQYINKYAPESDANKPKQYIDYIINYFKQNGYDINENTKLSEIVVI